VKHSIEEIQRAAYQRYCWRVRVGCQPEDEAEAREMEKLDWELAEINVKRKVDG